MIPDFEDSGNLPPGLHEVHWTEFEVRFGKNEHRKNMLKGLKEALSALKRAGCKKVFINGSFVTFKDIPGDYDGCYDLQGLSIEQLRLYAPALLDFADGRAKQKAVYLGEMFPNSVEVGSGLTFSNFFQICKHSGKAKGICVFNLDALQ